MSKDILLTDLPTMKIPHELLLPTVSPFLSLTLLLSDPTVSTSGSQAVKHQTSGATVKVTNNSLTTQVVSKLHTWAIYHLCTEIRSSPDSEEPISVCRLQGLHVNSSSAELFKLLHITVHHSSYFKSFLPISLSPSSFS
jgi:hypothetical protein